MNCSHPVLAVDLGVDEETGKKRIKIIPTGYRPDYSIEYLERLYGKDHLLKLPCGKCLQCKEAKKQDWAIRCDMEAQMYDHNSVIFLTLTYRDECCPHWLSKGHLKKFLKRIKNHTKSVRWFACGEYGENTNRPHYHVLLYGFTPSDLQLVVGSKTKSGYEVYESNSLTRLWNKGFVQVAKVDRERNAGFYVAGYVNKKTGINDGFLMHSRRLGYDYMIQNFQELRDHRFYISQNGKVFYLPRCFKAISQLLGYKYEDDPDMKERMRKLETSEMLQRGLKYRENLFPYGDKKMKDKLQKRL